MVRTPEWKLVRHFEAGGQDELYYLAEDPGETRDLASSAEPNHRGETRSTGSSPQGLDGRIGDRLTELGSGDVEGALPHSSRETGGRSHP